MPDVPDIYDVKINGNGYVFYDDSGRGFSAGSRAYYGYSPTFVTKQNIQGNYGDEQEDFFLSWTQKDWSGGEGQKYYRQDDTNKANLYWQGANVNITQEGQVTIAPGGTSTATCYVNCYYRPKLSTLTMSTDTYNIMYYADNNNTPKALKKIDVAGTITTICSTTKSYTQMAGDGYYLYVSDGSRIDALDIFTLGSSVTSFSSTSTSDICYHNNSLYGIYQDVLYVFDSSGNATDVGYWKNINGQQNVLSSYDLISSGGKLMILRISEHDGTELWSYDGTGVSLVNKFPENFYGSSLIEANGVLFISGIFMFGKVTTNEIGYKFAIMYYSNGTEGILWENNSILTSSPSVQIATLASYVSPVCLDGVIYFQDYERLYVCRYDPSSGSISSIIPTGGSLSSDLYYLSTGTNFLFSSGSAISNYITSNAGIPNSSGYVITSLFDFGSSLPKYFRGVKVEAIIPTATGTSSSVDVYYQVDSLDGGWTLAASNITSGSEIILTGVTGQSIAIKVVLNKGTTTTGPTLKRIYVRAAPELKQFRLGKYILNLMGSPVKLRNGQDCPRSGQTMANELVTAFTATTPITVEDVFGSYTAVLKPDDFQLEEVSRDKDNNGLYIATVGARGV